MAVGGNTLMETVQMNACESSCESEIVEETLAGSPDAFAEIVRRHQASVRTVIAKWVSCPSTTDDIAQDVFVAAYAAMSSFDGSGTLAAWLAGIAKNKTREHLRAEVRRRQHEKNTLPQQLEKWRLQALEQTESLAGDEHVALEQCIERLAPESGRLVRQHYFSGKSLETIAAESRRSSGSLRMMLFRIRKALANCLRRQRQS